MELNDELSVLRGKYQRLLSDLDDLHADQTRKARIIADLRAKLDIFMGKLDRKRVVRGGKCPDKLELVPHVRTKSLRSGRN